MDKAAGEKKLMGERLETFLNGLRLGLTRRAAYGAVGISKTTFYRMLDNDSDGTLRDLIEKAEADAEARFAGLVARAAQEPKNWTAAAWWLERRRHEDYARREKVEMTVDVRAVAAQLAEAQGLDPDEVLAEAERILAEMG